MVKGEFAVFEIRAGLSSVRMTSNQRYTSVRRSFLCLCQRGPRPQKLLFGGCWKLPENYTAVLVCFADWRRSCRRSQISAAGHTTFLRRWINVNDVDSTSQQRRVPSGSVCPARPISHTIYAHCLPIWSHSSLAIRLHSFRAPPSHASTCHDMVSNTFSTADVGSVLSQRLLALAQYRTNDSPFLTILSCSERTLAAAVCNHVECRVVGYHCQLSENIRQRIRPRFSFSTQSTQLRPDEKSDVIHQRHILNNSSGNRVGMRVAQYIFDAKCW